MHFSKIIVGTLKSVFLLESFPALNKRNIFNVKLTGKDKKTRALSIRLGQGERNFRKAEMFSFYIKSNTAG